MLAPDLPIVNFTISPTAKREIEKIRVWWNENFSDPAAVAMIGWGLFNLNSGQKGENVVISFYGESQLSEVAHGIQHVSGLDVVFFTIPDYVPKFEGKVIDHAEGQGFFLRSP